MRPFQNVPILFSFNSGNQVIICESEQGIITCPSGSTVKIHSASYGRSSTSVCIHAHLPETNCDSTEDITGKLTTFSFVFFYIMCTMPTTCREYQSLLSGLCCTKRGFKIGFDIPCKFSSQENIYMNCHTLFFGKIRKKCISECSLLKFVLKFVLKFGLLKFVPK